MKIVVLTLVLSLSGANAPSPKQEATAAGQYCGRLWSNGALVQTNTEFKTESDGRLTGTYQFADVGTMTAGTLDEPAPVTGLEHTLDWQDKYGSGKLTLTFKPDYSGFTGKWRDQSGAPNELWDGVRC
ncbi:hypothetical protein D0Y60_13490 [Shinella sp. WSJ-2]|uniref:hypothetical protein n=1 Tax=Shinella sp. WSJ-2 TaxID=2303749 RepID=UPI000E3DCF4E|nr:hypothetical protein [Shinella sp. WSJ-2]RFZ87001.1 hypothetical protein D0Y60_13490 [Shinella sp. WSJ-2]